MSGEVLTFFISHSENGQALNFLGDYVYIMLFIYLYIYIYLIGNDIRISTVF